MLNSSSSFVRSLYKRFNRRARSSARQANRRRFLVEQLENRRLLAGFNAVGSTLNIDLNVANKNVSIVSLGSSYRLTLTGDTWTGANSANVTGSGTAVLTVTSAGQSVFDTIKITDSANGSSVTFNDSGVNSFSDNLSVVLDNTGAGPIHFNGATSFSGASSLTVSTTNAVSLASGSSISTVNGAMTLKANQLNWATTSVTSVSGAISLYADAINLSASTIVQTANIVQLAPRTAGTLINLGGNDVLGTLGLTDAELDRIAASKIAIGDANSGAITVSAAITSNTNLALTSGSGGIFLVAEVWAPTVTR